MWYLAVDFGTSFSAGAMLVDRGVVALEIAGAPRSPSAVLLAEDGTLVVGNEAVNQAVVFPERVERTPKRRIGRSSSLLLGGQAVPLATAVGAILDQFLQEGRRRRGGESPAEVVLTHPVRWGAERLDGLRQAAQAIGIASPKFVPEPVGAAVYYADEHVGDGQYVAVYDLGGGTFDTAVLRRSQSAFELVGLPGGDERIGGEDFDFRLYQYIGQMLANDDPGLWNELTTSTERKWKRANAELMAEARKAKESLSRYPTARLLVREADRDLLITREEFEQLIAADVRRTVDELSATISRSGLTDDQVARVYLAGGSSRIPLVHQLLSERYGDRVTTWDDPKCVVAMGAAKLLGESLVLTPGGSAPTPPGPGTVPPVASAAPPMAPPRPATTPGPAVPPPGRPAVPVAGAAPTPAPPARPTGPLPQPQPSVGGFAAASAGAPPRPTAPSPTVQSSSSGYGAGGPGRPTMQSAPYVAPTPGGSGGSSGGTSRTLVAVGIVVLLILAAAVGGLVLFGGGGEDQKAGGGSSGSDPDEPTTETTDEGGGITENSLPDPGEWGSGSEWGADPSLTTYPVGFEDDFTDECVAAGGNSDYCSCVAYSVTADIPYEDWVAYNDEYEAAGDEYSIWEVYPELSSIIDYCDVSGEG
jgi:actin-like ATPase involved in cell morphogenesis